MKSSHCGEGTRPKQSHSLERVEIAALPLVARNDRQKIIIRVFLWEEVCL